MGIEQTLEFARWLKRLKDRRARLQIDIRVRRLANGNPGEHRVLDADICELKIREGQGYRVYYTVRGERFVVLLCGGDKSSKKQQQADIARARALAADLGETYDD